MEDNKLKNLFFSPMGQNSLIIYIPISVYPSRLQKFRFPEKTVKYRVLVTIQRQFNVVFMAKDVLTKNLAYPIVTADGVQFFCHRPTPPAAHPFILSIAIDKIFFVLEVL